MATSCISFAIIWYFFLWAAVKVSSTSNETNPVEEDWGDGLKVLSIYRPEICEHQAKKNDVIHYHYVGRLASDGSIFGRSFDYNSPYIVALGHGRIIPGMDRGLMDMCLWERRRITFPSDLGYGSRGVGSTIPPNATLVFYVRLIKIERNGHALGEDEDFSSIWNSGLFSYTNQKWSEAVDMMEEALRLYNLYRNQTLTCIKQCEEGDQHEHVTGTNKKFLESATSHDFLIDQFLLYGSKGRCIKHCKETNLSPKLRNPDPALIRDFHQYLPYSYLHYSYYQLENFEEGARCCFTFLHRNPSDKLALASVPFYRHRLNMSADEYIYRDPAIDLYQESYKKGKKAYFQEEWLKAVNHFEKSLDIFEENIHDCFYLCEDVINVNLTQPNMNKLKEKLLEENNFKADSMEFYELLVSSVKEVLKCRDNCYNEAQFIDGQHVDDYLRSHFDYLQFTYFKLGNAYKTAQSAATYLALEPSSDTMTDNVRYYTNTFKLTEEDFVPRKEFMELHEVVEMNARLLYFAEHGTLRKKKGKKGDAGAHLTHQEL